MERLIEGVPGEEAAVWVQDRGGGPLRLRGHILVEDLSTVLTNISSRNGANGPFNPVTQYMLARAAKHLADRLIDDAMPAQDDRDSVPRILSSALGHQPFVESVLGMSQHQMLRRWPLATDWYTDVINYVMRPARFDLKFDTLMQRVARLASGTFGEFVRQFAYEAYTYADNQKVVRVAEALQSLWPDYGPVQNAMGLYRQELHERYVPVYRAERARRPAADIGIAADQTQRSADRSALLRLRFHAGHPNRQQEELGLDEVDLAAVATAVDLTLELLEAAEGRRSFPSAEGAAADVDDLNEHYKREAIKRERRHYKALRARLVTDEHHAVKLAHLFLDVALGALPTVLPDDAGDQLYEEWLRERPGGRGDSGQ